VEFAMNIPFNDLVRRPAPDAAVGRVLRRGWYLLGPETEAFEREFAVWCGGADCVSVANGTDAIELALRAAGVGPGDEVATVANAGMYSTCAIRAAGAAPLYVDVDPLCGLMDPGLFERAIGPATRALVVTHLYGRMAPLPELLEIARTREIAVIEDCAQAHGAALDGRKAGVWGLAGCFSFYPTKNLGACGDAGAIVTSDPDFAARVRSLRQYGWTAKYDSALPGGRNSRIDELQAAVLRDRLPLLDADNRRRREIARRYTAALAAWPEVLSPPSEGAADWVAHLYVVRSPRRGRLREWLDARGIRTDVHYPIPDPDQRSQQGLSSRCVPAGLPVTRRLAGEILSLPCFPELRDEEVDAVIASILEWCSQS
jgi:dTDP-4-amino-4,6-dideoxygalactose transaminase